MHIDTTPIIYWYCAVHINTSAPGKQWVTKKKQEEEEELDKDHQESLKKGEGEAKEGEEDQNEVYQKQFMAPNLQQKDEK